MDGSTELFWEERLKMISSDTCEYNFLELLDSLPVHENYIVPKDISKSIRRIVGEEVDKQFVLITSVIQITLSRYFQRKQIVIFSPILNSKYQSKVSSNSIPLVASIDCTLTLKEVIIDNSNNIVNAYRFQNYIDKVNQKTHDILNNNLGVICVQIHNADQFKNSCRYILEINIDNEEIAIKITDKKQKVTNISRGFIRLLIHFLQQLENPDNKIKSIPWYPEIKIQKKINQCVKVRDEKIKVTLMELFEKQVKLTPTALALTFREIDLSYNDLNKRVNKFMNYLTDEYDVGSGKGIILYLNKSVNMYIAIMAILKCKAYYIPIRVGALNSEVDFVFSNVDSDLVIIENNDLVKIEQYNKKCLIIDLEIDSIEKSDNNPLHDSNIDPISYIMYTSGSTGIPKGVIINESAIVNML